MELLKSIIDRTEVLESLDWDEVAFDQLVSFMSLQKECSIPVHPSQLLKEIEIHFGESTRLVMEKIMKREYEIINNKKSGL